MKKWTALLTSIVLLFAMFSISGCATDGYETMGSDNQQRLQGAGIGAAVGAVLGGIVDRKNPGRGMAIGAFFGGLGGLTVAEVRIRDRVAREAARRNGYYEFEDTKNHRIYSSEPVRPVRYETRTLAKANNRRNGSLNDRRAEPSQIKIRECKTIHNVVIDSETGKTIYESDDTVCL